MIGWLKTLKTTFGFIQDNKTGAQYFFHRDDFNGHWNDLQTDFNDKSFGKIELIFEDENSEKGPRASNVRRSDFPNQ